MRHTRTRTLERHGEMKRRKRCHGNTNNCLREHTPIRLQPGESVRVKEGMKFEIKQIKKDSWWVRLLRFLRLK